jgi:hypothetical protein
MTHGTASGSPFLVGQGNRAGIRLLLAPDFVLDSGDREALIIDLPDAAPAGAPPGVRIIRARTGERWCIVYRTFEPVQADIGIEVNPERPLTDQEGRHLVLKYGFVCRSFQVDLADEKDLDIARTAALATYRRFNADELDFATETSTSYPLRSTTLPIAQPSLPGRPENDHTGRSSRFSSPEFFAARDSRNLRRQRRLVLARRWLITLTLIVAGLAVLQILAPRQVSVPRVIGMSPAEAQQKLDSAGLISKTRPLEGSAACVPGTVVGQLPSEGADVPPGSTVAITVCASRIITMPDLVGVNYSRATDTLRKLDLMPKVHYVGSADRTGTVIRTNPATGNKIRQGSKVDLYVSIQRSRWPIPPAVLTD